MIENGEYFFWTYRGDVYGGSASMYGRFNDYYYSTYSTDTGSYRELWRELTCGGAYKAKKVLI
jgi:hypothetical protein